MPLSPVGLMPDGIGLSGWRGRGGEGMCLLSLSDVELQLARLEKACESSRLGKESESGLGTQEPS